MMQPENIDEINNKMNNDDFNLTNQSNRLLDIYLSPLDKHEDGLEIFIQVEYCF